MRLPLSVTDFKDSMSARRNPHDSPAQPSVYLPNSDVDLQHGPHHIVQAQITCYRRDYRLLGVPRVPPCAGPCEARSNAIRPRQGQMCVYNALHVRTTCCDVISFICCHDTGRWQSTWCDYRWGRRQREVFLNYRKFLTMSGPA